MPASLSPESVLVRNERIAWRVLEGDAVILFPEAGSLHRLNGTGTRMWELLDGSRTLGSIAELLVDEYEVTFDQATDELTAVAADLLEANLVAAVG
jgi:hypothetical protein